MNSKERHEARYQRRKAKREEKIRKRSEQYTDWDNVYGFIPLTEGYKNVSKASKNRVPTQMWMANLTLNTRKVQLQLASGKWKSPGFHSFRIKERGKWRDIQSAHISEKGIQNSFANHCFIPIIRPHLIHDNGASLKGKGTSFSLNRFINFLREHIRKYGRQGGIFFFDFSSYFTSIVHEILINEANRYILNDRIMKYYKAFTCAYGKIGLGLGSQVSQISALLYPNRIDHLMKDQLGIKPYGKHMDDGYIICDSLEKLKEYAEKFTMECRKLGIRMNQKKCRIIKLTKPFIFLKARFFITETGKIVRRISKEVSGKERHRLRKFRDFYRLGIMSAKEIYLNFHSWIMSLYQKTSFHTILNAISYYNGLFSDFQPYTPLKLNKRKYKRVAYIARLAA